MTNKNKAIIAGAAIGALSVAAVGLLCYLRSKSKPAAKVYIFSTEGQDEKKVDDLLPKENQPEPEMKSEEVPEEETPCTTSEDAAEEPIPSEMPPFMQDTAAQSDGAEKTPE